MSAPRLDGEASPMARLARAARQGPTPALWVDRAALRHNLEALRAPLLAAGKGIRLASKSLRNVDLLRWAAEQLGRDGAGVMSYRVAEALSLFELGFDDQIVAYPEVEFDALLALAAAHRDHPGLRLRLVVDCGEHIGLASAAARQVGVSLPVVIDLDVSTRLAGGAVHLGVRRSPVRRRAELLRLWRAIDRDPHLSCAGLMAYEAQVAGLSGRVRGHPVQSLVQRSLRRLAGRSVPRVRRRLVRAVEEAAGRPVDLVNGGGSGSVALTAADPAVTEVTIGSGLLCGHLFDHIPGVALRPALFVALRVTRRPAPRIVTCTAGGYVASGAGGRDRLPLPAYPCGLRLTRFEGAGEVQTPFLCRGGRVPPLGDVVLLRPAKTGEIAERFDRCFVLEVDGEVTETTTYRGRGWCFG